MRVPCLGTATDHAKKKSLRYAEQLQPEIQQERQAWVAQVAAVEPQRFVFVDEANAKTTMARLYGRAPRGQRVVDYVPDGRWESTTMLAALSCAGSCAALTYEGGTDTMTMLTFAEEVLAPTLGPGTIVVMDNLSSHKDPRVIAALEATGAEVWFLPRYSPDLNPIEHMWSKVKACLRKAAARTTEALIAAIGQALRAVTGQDAVNWFAHCGYPNTNS